MKNLDSKVEKSNLDWGYGISNYNFNLKRINIDNLNLNFIGESVNHCKKITKIELINTELELIHKIIPQSYQIPNDGNVNQITTMISNEITPKIYNDYLKVISFLSKSVFEEDLFFENAPYLRFHFPQKLPDKYRLNNGEVASYHSDLMLGDYNKQYNCWLSISSTVLSNSLQVMDIEKSCEIIKSFIDRYNLNENDFYQSRGLFFDFINENKDAYNFIKKNSFPLSTNRSELIIFDPATVHGTAENKEDQTRVSIDFRIIKKSDFTHILETIEKQNIPIREFSGMKQLPGGYYHEKSIQEIIT